jgi:hypothetical protein
MRTGVTATVLLTALTLIGARPARAHEVEAQLFGNGWGLQGGLRLADHVVLLAGLTAGLWQDAGEVNGASFDEPGWHTTVPVEIKLYLRTPGAGRLVPTLRPGAAWSYLHLNGLGSGGLSSHAVTGSLLVGAQYFVTERLGLSVETGVAGGRMWASGDAVAIQIEWFAGTVWRAGLTLRL